jgi:TatA/E family protein of Tat protein translocase
MFGLGFGELVVVFLIALIFIGPKKLPELAKGLGKGIKQFQDAAKGLSDQLQDTNDSSSNPTPKIADAAQKDEIIPPASPLDDKDKPQT